MVAVYCGIDWAEGRLDIALVDEGGRLVGKRRIQESVEGFAELGVMLAAAGDSADRPIPVAIEPPRGGWLLRCGPRADRSSDQPVGGGPVSGTHVGVGQEE